MILDKLPFLTPSSCQFDTDIVRIGTPRDITPDQKNQLETFLKTLKPWRKGPFNLFGIEIDTEWRSDMKWNRLKSALPPLQDKKVLDIGCSSGYYMFRIAAYHPKLVVGIDPIDTCFFQFQTLQKYASLDTLFFVPCRCEELTGYDAYFDVVFCMGILYHSRSPLSLLERIYSLMKKKGALILEMLIVSSKENTVLSPGAPVSSRAPIINKRYAGMRNVHAIPSISCAMNWLERSGFSSVSVVSVSPTTIEEQRKTEWSTAKSLADFLDPLDKTKTIEGYPAPIRAVFIAEK